MSVHDLIEDAMCDVRVVMCARCKGFGDIGEPSLRIKCPECRGCGVTTTSELEVDQMHDFVLTVVMKNVAEGDATDLAQQIWDEHADSYDAARGDFAVSISRDGFPVDWRPMEAA